MPEDPGSTLMTWNGGGPDRLGATAGRGGLDHGGRTPRGDVLGAPDFVNAAFVARFPGGRPAGTPLFVVR